MSSSTTSVTHSTAPASGEWAPYGTIHIVYDHDRTPNGEVVMATLNEEDVRAARAVKDQWRLRIVIAQLQEAILR